METIRVKHRGNNYLLFNLSAEIVRELESDPDKMETYTEKCLQSGLNICLLENEENSDTLTANRTHYMSAPASSQSDNKNDSVPTPSRKKFSFLCGKFEREQYIYAVKFDKHPWHYFPMLDSLASEHKELPSSIAILIEELSTNDVKTISLNLTEDQSINYFSNGQFVFKNKRLKLHMEIVDRKSANQTPQSSATSTPSNRVAQLKFVPGESNPLLFLLNFEKCFKTDKDKMYNICDFAEECHKAEFSRLYFTSDWPCIKSAFLKFYSLSFGRNKKKELNIDFNEETSLRSFVKRKLSALSTFTTLPFINQIEMVMNELPVEISTMFITNEKMTGTKTEILDFCDKINDLAKSFLVTTEDNSNESDNGSPEPLNKMKEFNFTRQTGAPDPRSQLSECELMLVDETPQSSRGRGRGRGRGGRGRGVGNTISGIKKKGRPTKKKIEFHTRRK